MDYQAKYAEAKASGYSDTEIAQHLGGAKYAEAIKEGHTDADIIKHFTGVAPEASQPEPEHQVQADPKAKFYELEKQQGAPKTPGEKLKQFGNQFLEGLKSPVPGSLLSTPLRAVQETSQQLGADVARKTGSRVAGFAASAATDPISYFSGPEAGLVKSAFGGANKAGNGILKTVMKIGANRSEAAVEQGAKAGWKLPNVAAHEIEAAVSNVQNVLKSSVEEAGSFLNKAKTELGLPTTAAEKESSLLKNGNVFGLGKEEINAATRKFISKHKTAESLANSITEFKSGYKGTEPKLRAKVAMALQDHINQFVDWEKSGNQVQGLLKQQYRQLGDMVQEVMPKEVRQRMASALSLKDDLGKVLGLEETEGTGKAEQFLRNLFEAKTAKSKDYLKRFADLEVMTGQPVLQELFKKFAGQDLHVLAGRPFLAGISAAGALSGHPGALVPLVGQSPRALSAIGRAGSKLSGSAEKAAGLAAGGARGFTLNQMSSSNQQKLEEHLKRLRGGK